MSIDSIMASSLSALQANQAALRNTSTNVANVNTEGYTRLDTQFVSRTEQGGLYGVEVEVQRAANRYLAEAEMRSAASVASTQVRANFLDRAQGLFGDPSDGGSVFSAFDGVLNSFNAVALDPSAGLRQSDAVANLNTLVDQLDRTSLEMMALRDEANMRVKSVVDETNALMQSIAKLNGSIQQARIAGADSTQAESEQSRLLDRLSELVAVRTQERSLGGVEVRTLDGMLLVNHEASQLTFSEVTGPQQYARIEVKQPHAVAPLPFEASLDGGELQGLLQVRDVDLADMSAAFGEYAAGVMEAVNAAHNEASSVPAPNALIGVNTGLVATDQHGLSGVAHLGLTDAGGVLTANVRIDFSTGVIINPAGATLANFGANATIQDMVNGINTALGGSGTATFSQGVLTLQAANVTEGVVVRQDDTTPSDRSGRGFAHAFGLNNLLEKPTPTSFATGLSSTSAHGLTAGQSIVLDLKSADGTVIRQATATVSATGGTMADLLNDMNSSLLGYGAMSLDSDGRIVFTPSGTSGVERYDLVSDTTTRGDTGLAISQLFGLGDAIPAMRARSIEVRSDISNNPSLLATAKPDLDGVIVGTLALAPGDGRGAIGLESAGERIIKFGASGNMMGQTTSINDYAARLAGSFGSKANAAEAAASAASSVREEIQMRRQADEGVNIDEELVKMTQYQQAYSAASRMIQAAKDLYDTLLSVV